MQFEKTCIRVVSQKLQSGISTINIGTRRNPFGQNGLTKIEMNDIKVSQSAPQQLVALPFAYWGPVPAGPENLIIVATPHKLKETPRLLVDTGDFDLDETISGRRQVICGYRIAQLKEVAASSNF